MPDGHVEDPFVWLSADELDLEAIDSGLKSPFDESAYLRAFPDIARAVHTGQWRSGWHHYEEHGNKELRLQDSRYIAAIHHPYTTLQASSFPLIAGNIDALFITRSGRCLVVGWANDIDGPIVDITIRDGSATLGIARSLARCRRPDAETSLGATGAHLLGFWCLTRMREVSGLSERVTIEVRTHSNVLTLEISPSFVSDIRLRELIFSYFAGSEYFGNRDVESYLQLERGIGQELTTFNSEISLSITAHAESIRFGTEPSDLQGSIVVCLYGKSEFLFLQSAFFSTSSRMASYEFIYVSNSPDLTEKLQREANIASRIYGVSIILVILPENAGFGAANNVAVSLARSRRIIIANPDVFPRGDDWAALHGAILAERPAEETRIFGVPLYYDDGSLMHGGLYFEMDERWSIRPNGIERRRLARVEHFGKGAPTDESNFARARQVPGVTGALISVDREWFEKLGGFSLSFAFGHYEDADLCLKSLAQGQPVWMQNVPFWHLEGKGSTRLPIHEGGSMVNRWHFTSRWSAALDDGLLGRRPGKLVTP